MIPASAWSFRLWGLALGLAGMFCLLFPCAAQPALLNYSVTTYWASGAPNPRVIKMGPAGRLWVGLSDGSVRILEDQNHDGVVDHVKTFVGGAWSPHGLAFRQDGAGWDVYVAHLTAPLGGTGRITRFVDQNGDDIFETVQTVIQNMPTGAHQVNNLTLDPSATWLYFAQGATSNSGPGGGALVGRVGPLAQNLPWGSPQIQIYATGLRNPWGLVFHPGGSLFATDNGRDDLGPLAPPDELNRLLQGKDYGFPAVSGMPPPGNTSEAPVGLLAPHASANGLTFDTATTLSGFEQQLFIAEWGGWGGSPPGKIIQANLHQDGAGQWHFESWDFLVGCGRPLDVEIGPGGCLYFSVQSPATGWPVGVYRVAPTFGVAVRLSGQPEPGQSVFATVHAPGHGGQLYVLGVSAGSGPLATPLGPVGLSPDAILALSLSSNPYISFSLPGSLSASGVSPGTDQIHLPPWPALSGLQLYVAAVTMDPQSGLLTGLSPTARLSID